MFWKCARWEMLEVKRSVKTLSNCSSATVCPKPSGVITGVLFPVCRGSLGLSRLSAWWVALGIDLERGRPGHPQDNGAHERMHKDISREVEALGQSDQEALDLWRETFNYERPHEALGMRC